MLTPVLEKFLEERRVRAENFSRRSEAGRCPDCGKPRPDGTPWIRCNGCRVKGSRDRGVMDVLGSWESRPDIAPFGDHS